MTNQFAVAVFANIPFVKTHTNIKQVLQSFTFYSSGTKNETKYPYPQNTKLANNPNNIVDQKLSLLVSIPIDQNTNKIIIRGYKV